MMVTKKSYMVPETAFEQFLKPLGILMGSLGTGGDPLPQNDDEPHAPGRRPF